MCCFLVDDNGPALPLHLLPGDGLQAVCDSRGIILFGASSGHLAKVLKAFLGLRLRADVVLSRPR